MSFLASTSMEAEDADQTVGLHNGRKELCASSKLCISLNSQVYVHNSLLH